MVRLRRAKPSTGFAPRRFDPCSLRNPAAARPGSSVALIQRRSLVRIQPAGPCPRSSADQSAWLRTRRSRVRIAPGVRIGLWRSLVSASASGAEGRRFIRGRRFEPCTAHDAGPSAWRCTADVVEWNHAGVMIPRRRSSRTSATTPNARSAMGQAAALSPQQSGFESRTRDAFWSSSTGRAAGC